MCEHVNNLTGYEFPDQSVAKGLAKEVSPR